MPDNHTRTTDTNDKVQIALDNMEQLSDANRARALMTLTRNILWQVQNDGNLFADEIESHIIAVAKDHKCA